MAWPDSAVVLLFAAVTITTLLTPAQSLLSRLTSFVGFEHESYNIGEGNGSVEVCVKVIGVLEGSLHLSLTTVDGSATSEQCYL